VDMAPRYHLEPIGLLRVQVLGCDSLHASDSLLFGGKSDPYVVLRVGAQTSHTSTRRMTLKPRWASYIVDFFIYNLRQELQLDVFDNLAA
jgi:Ca2+-dependent lipid-binding protein